MPRFSVTVRNEDTGETLHRMFSSRSESFDHADAVFNADRNPPSDGNWIPGPAPFTFYQLDPELDTFSFAYFGRLEDAQKAGLAGYREHMEIMQSHIGNLYYVKQPPFPEDPDMPDSWRIADSLHPDRHVTMFQVVACRLESPDEREQEIRHG
jgi:hypothetical protein